MALATIPGFLTKKEVTELYGRSHRSLTRDFSSAVRTGDDEVLTHLKLHTEDGQLRSGSEITLKQIQELSNSGLSPTWYIEESWASERYGTRDKLKPDVVTAEKKKEATHEERKSEQPFIPSDTIQRLESQIEDLQRDKEKLYDELSIKNEQIQQANERTRESNILMKELQALLGNVQERALLPLPVRTESESSPHATEVKTVHSEKTAELKESKTKQPKRKQSKTAQKSPDHSPKAKKSANNKHNATKQASQPSKSKPSTTTKKKSPKATTSKKSKWYKLRSMKRILSRS